jgi:hypothetical protein
MALVACHECKKEVSTEAKTCPACGAKVRKPPKQVSRNTLIILGLLALAFVGVSIEGQKAREQEAAAKTPAQRAAEQKERTQDALAAVGAATLKKAMKDPQSFSLTSLVVMDDGAACYKYRAVNSFGASLPSRAVLLPSGKMFTEDHDGNSFVNAFNKGCAKKMGREIVKIVEMAGTLR